MRDAHTREGATRLTALAEELQKPEIWFAAFGALNHHTAVPDYSGACPEDAFLWGLTDLMQVCDIFHALVFDATRSYVAAREGGTLTPGDIERITLQGRATNPVIEGRAIDIRAEVKRRLGVPSL